MMPEGWEKLLMKVNDQFAYEESKSLFQIIARTLLWYSTTLLITTPDSPRGHYYRSTQYEIDQPNLIFAAPMPLSTKNYMRRTTDSTTSSDLFNLPQNVKVLPWPLNKTSFVVRFHNMDDDQDAAIDLTNYLNINPQQYNIKEMSLTGVQDLQSMLQKKIDWTYGGQNWQDHVKNDYTIGINLDRPF